jgi:ribosomal-protein-alanine N-acetyltransferase
MQTTSDGLIWKYLRSQQSKKMTNPHFQIRDGDAGDLALVVALERRTALAPLWSESAYASILTPAGLDVLVRRCLLVAENGDTLLGFAVGKWSGPQANDAAELESVVVDETSRRIGIGRALCSAVLDWGRNQGVTVFELEVRAGSTGAIALYAALGFVVVGQRRAYYHDPTDDALLMRLYLAKGE